MKKSIVAVVVLATAAALQAAEINERVRFDTNAKDLAARTFTNTFGETVKVKLTGYADEIFGRWVVDVTADIENTGKKPLNFSCGVAFFDSKGKLLCAANFKADALKKDEKWELAPGEKRRIDRMIDIPFNVIGQIASMQAILYESEEVFGVDPNSVWELMPDGTMVKRPREKAMNPPQTK
jgi:hypothetical protein